MTTQLTKIFTKEFNESLVHQVTTDFMSNLRSGTKAQKNRSAVSGGGAKPRPQKGSGRARAGTTRSPIWNGGGVTFASTPRDYSQKVNRKMYRGAMQSILSELIRQERMVVVEDFGVEAPKTKEVVGKLKALDLASTLIVVEEVDSNLYLATRNLKDVDVVDVEALNPVSLLRFEKVLFTVSSLKNVEEKLG